MHDFATCVLFGAALIGGHLILTNRDKGLGIVVSLVLLKILDLPDPRLIASRRYLHVSGHRVVERGKYLYWSVRVAAPRLILREYRLICTILEPGQHESVA
jgi:hypothetical protein